MATLVESGLGRDSLDSFVRRTSKHDLKVALRQADRQQNAIRKTKTWGTERTAFEPPLPQPAPKEKGMRNALRRKTRKLRSTPESRQENLDDSLPPALYRSDSFEYGDDLKREPTQAQKTPPVQAPLAAPLPRIAQSDAKTQLLNLKAQQRQRRAQQKEAEKRTKAQEKAQRRELARKVKQERFLELIKALASRHPRQNLRRVRGEPQAEIYTYQPGPAPLQRAHYHAPVSPESWVGSLKNPSVDIVSPIGTPAIYAPFYPQRYTPSPATIPRVYDFGSEDELLAHLQGRSSFVKVLEHKPQELPAYERLAPAFKKVEPVEVSTDLPDRDSQTDRPKSKLVYCDVCSKSVSLSGVFYSCTTCGPREGGIVCSGCVQEQGRCLRGLHDLESSKQIVQRATPKSPSLNEPLQKLRPESEKPVDGSDDASTTLSRIRADTASQTLCLATMQKKIVRMEAGIETQNKTTEKLASWLEEAMERQREQATDLTKSMLDEFRAERIANMNTIKRLSTKRKPRRQSSEGSNPTFVLSRDQFRERDLALRERELNIKERQMALEERREAARERTEKPTPAPTPNPLPSQSLTSAPTQENRTLLEVMNKLNRIEGISALALRQAPNFQDKVIEQVVERALTLVTSHIRERPSGVKRKASESTGVMSSIQSTPVSGLSTVSFLQPPARTTSRSNKDEEDDDGHSPKRPKNQSAPVPESGRKPLLACPYSKLDFNRYSHRNVTELNYRGCSSCVLSDISRLKQHLYRVHQYPEYHCPRCWDDLATKEQLDTHLRLGCEKRTCPYPEKFSDASQLKKKWPRKSPTDCWYMVFKILFPGHRLPASPYAEDLATGTTALAPNTPPQPIPSVSISPELIKDVVRRQLEARSLSANPTEHAFLLSLVSDATSEALRMISASPTPVTNSNPSSAVLHSLTYGSSPDAESALTDRRTEHVNPPAAFAGTGTLDSTFGTFTNLQDLSSLGSGINEPTPLSRPQPSRDPSTQPDAIAAPAMSSNQSSGTFSGLSPLPGTENLMDFDDDLIQLKSNEIMAPIKPSNSTRTVDSGYGSMHRNPEGILSAYPGDPCGDLDGEGSNSSSSSSSSSSGGGTGSPTVGGSGGGGSVDSLLDPEMYERLRRDHGDDVFLSVALDWPLDGSSINGAGVGGGIFG